MTSKRQVLEKFVKEYNYSFGSASAETDREVAFKNALLALEKLEPSREELMVDKENFIRICNFLSNEGYLDDDWWSEKPTALEKYFKELT